METSSRTALISAGCGFVVTGVGVGRLTADGYSVPSFAASAFWRESRRANQYRAAFVLVLWGIFCAVMAFHLK
jgi:hypothetical protein